MSLNYGQQDKTTTSTQNSSTTSNPWAPAIPALTGLINSAAGTPTAVTPAQQQAFSQLLTNAAAGNPETGNINAAATSQLTAPNQVGQINQGLANETQQLTPIANGSLTDLSKNPQIQGLLSTIQQDVGNKVNQEFAGAGRALSPGNSQALARGISQGEAAPLLNEYNTLLGAQIGAATGLGTATTGAATAAGQSLANQAGIQNQGLTTNQAGLAATNYAPTTALNVSEEQTQLPFQNLGLLASLIAPLAGLGGTSNTNANGVQNTTGTSSGIGLNILSDEHAKEDKRKVGEMADGTPIHSWRYKGDPVTHVGPMAQEVEKRNPDAVSTRPDGLKTVDMRAATDRAAAIVRRRVAAHRKAA